MKDYVDIGDVARTADLRQICERAGVKLMKRGAEYVGLCPFHAERTPSFTVVIAKGDRHFFKCHGCGAGGDAVDFVRKTMGCDIRTAVTELGGGELIARADVDKTKLRAAMAKRDEDDAAAIERKRRNAFVIWKEGQAATGSPVEAYLRARGVQLPPGSSLRYHPKVYCAESGLEMPAMLAAVVDAQGTFGALHRTYLSYGPQGWGKAGVGVPKKVLGRFRGGAIRLFPSEIGRAGEGVLYIAEGIETALSVLRVLRETSPEVLRHAAVWAAVSLTNMGRVILPMIGGESPVSPLRCPFTRVVLCVDNDMTDQKAVDTEIFMAAQNYGPRGCRVLVARPAPGTDFNDMILGKGADRIDDGGGLPTHIEVAPGVAGA
jgi:DNA primase